MLATYFPCAIYLQHSGQGLGVKDMLVSAALMIVTSLTAGTVVNLLWTGFSPATAAVFVLLALLPVLPQAARRSAGTHDYGYLFNGKKTKAGLD